MKEFKKGDVVTIKGGADVHVIKEVNVCFRGLMISLEGMTRNYFSFEIEHYKIRTWAYNHSSQEDEHYMTEESFVEGVISKAKEQGNDLYNRIY